MNDLIDAIFFQDLAKENPEDVCRRTLCQFDKLNECYVIVVWGNPCKIYPYQSKIEHIGGPYDGQAQFLDLFIIHYLLKAKEREISKHWISEKDIPGGPTFFRGPHEIPTHLISGQFKNDIEAFKKRCAQHHGIFLNMADAAYRFEITPRIPVAVLYWCGDEDFPTAAKILYDRSILEHLPSDIIFALAVGICSVLGRSPD